MGIADWGFVGRGRGGFRIWDLLECGIRTRRRPIGRDYAAAKDTECLKVCGARRRV